MGLESVVKRVYETPFEKKLRKISFFFTIGEAFMTPTGGVDVFLLGGVAFSLQETLSTPKTYSSLNTSNFETHLANRDTVNLT
jgi:hypothetical protein